MDADRRVQDDPALDALDQLCDAVRRSIRDAEQVLTRAEFIRSQRALGVAYRDVAPTEAKPLIVELLSDILAQLSDAGARWRRAEAKALHDEGLSMDRIADLFGVTRQRVSALLRATENRHRPSGSSVVATALPPPTAPDGPARPGGASG